MNGGTGDSMAIAPVAPVAGIAALRVSDRVGRAASGVAPAVTAGDRASFERALSVAANAASAAEPAGAEAALYRARPRAPTSLGDRILAIVAGSPGTAAKAGAVRGGGGRRDTGPALARAQARLARARARLEGVQDALDETGEEEPEQAREKMLAQAQARIVEAQAHLDEARASLEEARAGRRPAASGEADGGKVNGRPPQIGG